MMSQTTVSMALLRAQAQGPNGSGSMSVARCTQSDGKNNRMLPVQAVQHLRRMRGGSQSQLMRCSDGFDYVVKFQNNPQHSRVLINDWIGTRLAESIGLPVPVIAVVDVDHSLVEHTPELCFKLCGGESPITPGRSFGSRYLVSPVEGQVYDYMPESMMPQVRNLRDFAGVLVLDKWTCNADGRQVAFWRTSRQKKFTASFIDQGYCFNAGEWNFSDAPLRGTFPRNDVYRWITGWESFEPWLSRVETFPESLLWSLAEEIPPEWHSDDVESLRMVFIKLLERRSRLRELLVSFKNSSRAPFPNWTAT